MRPTAAPQMSRRLTSAANGMTRSHVKSSGSRRRDKARRRAAFTRLRQVGRVHSPETDMRPVLPHRELLMKSVSMPQLQQSQLSSAEGRTMQHDRSGSDNEPSNFIGHLAEKARVCAQLGYFDDLTSILHEAANPPLSVDPNVSQRAVVVNVVQWIASKDTITIEKFMNCLAEEGILQSLPNEDVGMILDLLVRGMIRRGDISNAFRGELLSRMLETRLRRGTYTELIAHCERLEIGLSIFHRAIGVGAVPNQKMFNVLLEKCFAASDGNRARAVLAEMAARDLRVNGDTIAVLLRQAPSVDSIKAVLQLLKAPGSSVRLSPGLAALFVEAFIAVGRDRAGDDTHVEMCFATVDWFFERGVGVSRQALDDLVTHCARTGRTEAALRAWREMRRSWAGAPSRRSRKDLWGALYAAEAAGGRNLSAIRALLEGHVAPTERAGLQRRVLACTEDAGRDEAVLRGEGDVKDRATVLHRWMRGGRAQDVMSWIGEEVERAKGRGIEAALVLSVLADTGATRSDSLRFCLEHLSSGESVCGRREWVVERAVQMVWRWILAGAGGEGEGGGGGFEGDGVEEALSGDMDVEELRSCLGRVVRVVE